MTASVAIPNSKIESVFRPALLLMSGRTLAFAATFFIPVVLARVLSLRTVNEPELGRVAPLGGLVDARTAYFHRGDTLVAVPLTGFAATQIARDSLHNAFALLSEPAGNTFGAVWFEPAPRLRITYTLPPAPRLP